MRAPHTAALAAVLVVFATSTVDVRQFPLSGAERTIVTYIDDHNEQAIALLEQVVNINSGTQNFAGVRRVGDIFRAELDALGFKTSWVDGAAWQRAGHLIGTHSGNGAPIVLIGHLDTVFEADSPFQKFERINATTAKGPGIIDMKGGDVIIIQALRALDAAGLLKSMNLVVVMTGDEESVGRPLTKAREALVTAATGAKAAIGFEDGDGDPRHAVVSRRGSTNWRLDVSGKAAHSSQVFSDEVGPGAIYEAARILHTFRERLSDQLHLTFNPGVILGGTSVQVDAAQSRGTAAGKTNVVAEKVTVLGDIRALTKQQFTMAQDQMQLIARQWLPHTVAELTFDEGYPPLPPSVGNEQLLIIYNQASNDLGSGSVSAVNPDRAGAADVSFLAGTVPMIIDAVGLKGHDDHTPGETADLTTMPVQAKRAAVTIARLAAKR